MPVAFLMGVMVLGLMGGKIVGISSVMSVRVTVCWIASFPLRTWDLCAGENKLSTHNHPPWLASSLVAGTFGNLRLTTLPGGRRRGMSGVEAPPPQMTQGLGCLVPIGSGLVGFGPCGILMVEGGGARVHGHGPC